MNPKPWRTFMAITVGNRWQLIEVVDSYRDLSLSPKPYRPTWWDSSTFCLRDLIATSLAFLRPKSLNLLING